MALTPRLVVQLVFGEPRPADGLCSRCLLPAVFDIPILSLTPDGVSPFGVSRWCADCRTPATLL